MSVTIIKKDPISIHAPLRERRLVSRLGRLYGIISIHAPLRERRFPTYGRCRGYIFQSTLPYGSDGQGDRVYDISIHAPLRERRLILILICTVIIISIHAPLRERPNGVSGNSYIKRISIHAPLRERRVPVNGQCVACIFQSTLPYGSDAV